MADSKEPKSSKKIIMEILERIRSRNQEVDGDAIPSSDDINKRLLGDMGISKDDTNKYLNMLVESHYIFSFKIVEGNENLKEKPIFGYVVAEHAMVIKIKENLKRSIEIIYEGQNYKRKPAGEVIKEVLSQGRHNNTPLGKAVNASIMLQQYENLLVESAEDYTEAWKIGQLNDLLNIHEEGASPAATDAPSDSSQTEAAPEPDSAVSVDVDLGDYGFPGEDGSSQSVSVSPPPAEASQRAVDLPGAAELQDMDLTGSWGQAVQKFGVEFLLRIHFRKYEFDTVINLVKTKRIAKEKDIRYIRDTMRKLDDRMRSDPLLIKHKAKIDSLKRLTQVRLNEIFMANKK
ncbi:MAG: hypothetical protein OEZ34_04425 [Spirochaetia bacterium]|nr:hypothetical protein [Spirochaetia bacterium]